MNLMAKTSVRVFIKTAVIALMVIIINVSLVALGICITRPKAGYTVYHSTDGGVTKTEVYTHYYKNGEDKNLEKYKNSNEYYMAEIAGSLEQKYLNAVNVATAICAIALLIISFYESFWKLGDKLATKKEFSNEGYDKLFGLKCALIGSVPFFISYIVLVITKALNLWGGYPKIYRLINYHVFYFIDLFLKNNNISILGVAVLILTLLPVPLISVIGFKFGTKHLSIKQKLVYKEDNNG